MKRPNTRGMTLLELLIGVSIILMLIAGVGLQTRGLIQKAKVIAAKATINGFALCLSMIKADTSLYPEQLKDVQKATRPGTSSQTVKFSARDWNGPYAETLSLKDPWGNDYFYWLTESTVFGPEAIERTTGQPYEETFTFEATPSPPKATLIVENPGVTSGSITLNGEEIVTEDEFKNTVPLIIKKVDLLASNTLTIRLASTPGLSINLRIAALVTSPDAMFVLGSMGKDGDFGGTKFDGDIVYGHFR